MPSRQAAKHSTVVSPTYSTAGPHDPLATTRSDSKANPEKGVKPTGTVAAGWPVRLNGKQNGVQPSGEDGWPLTSLSPGLPTSNAGTATVGVISRSKRARNRCTSV